MPTYFPSVRRTAPSRCILLLLSATPASAWACLQPLPPQALSDAHNFLFDERQRLLALQAENDELRLQEIQDRKNIHQLLQGAPAAPGRPGQPAHMPGPNVDHLLLQIESLHAQLNEQVRPTASCAHRPRAFLPVLQSWGVPPAAQRI